MILRSLVRVGFTPALLVGTVVGQVRQQVRPVKSDSAPVMHQVADQSASDPIVIVAFGDSTTAPRPSLRTFAAQLEERLSNTSHPVRVINAGIPGNNTLQARARSARDVIAHHPHIATIFFGINDSAVDVFNEATRPRVPLQEYERNLTQITTELQNSGIQPIILTPNPVGWTEQLKKLYGKPPYHPDDPDGWNVLLKDYAEAARRVAKASRVPLVDTYRLFQKYASQPGHTLNDLTLDGMHPNDLGHTIITNQLLEVIRNLPIWKRSS